MADEKTYIMIKVHYNAYHIRPELALYVLEEQQRLDLSWWAQLLMPSGGPAAVLPAVLIARWRSARACW